MGPRDRQEEGRHRRYNGLAFACAVIVALAASGAYGDQTGRATRAADQQLGWKTEALDNAVAFAKSLGTDTLLIMTDGKIVRSHGNLRRSYHVHSIRKALLSALVGQHAGPGAKQIDLDATLKDLGIDDDPKPLSPLQRQAKVLYLIKSTSGINHRAAAEAGLIKEKTRRLGHSENVPGTIWAYNNWDYNALTTVFEKQTGRRIAEAFKLGIADRIGIKDFTTGSVSYRYQPKFSRHKAAMFRMSARDLAKIGALYLAKGKWQGDQILPHGWVGRITADFTPTGRSGLRSGHGYLWWIPGSKTGLPKGTFWAWGFGQQALIVVPAWRTVIVHQADTTEFRKRLFGLIRKENIGGDAAIERLALRCLDPAHAKSTYCRQHRFILRREFRRLIALIVKARSS